MQGLSSISVVVSFDLENQILFNEGQMYVALSRVTKIDNLFLIVKYSPFVFKVNENAVIEYSRLRENLFDRIFKDHIRGVQNSLEDTSILPLKSQKHLLLQNLLIFFCF